MKTPSQTVSVSEQLNNPSKNVNLKVNNQQFSEGNICVAVRVRPFLPLETGNDRCVEVAINGNDEFFDTVQVENRDKSSFTFDAAFPSTSSQNDVFSSCVLPLIDACLDGYNATVLAYGQTGSGKTHTILGECEKHYDGQDNVEAGVIPRALNELFHRLDDFEANSKSDPCVKNKYSVNAQFLEVYGEDIRDLLTTKNPNKPLSIRDGRGGTEPEVVGASEVKVSSADEAILCLTRGMLKRVKRATAMNSESSRSHAIMTVVIEQLTIVEGDSPKSSTTKFKKSRFHFVDLAGSERAKRSGVTGQGLKEGININKGLLVLGNVISALGDPKKRGKSFVPYRDTKLTRLLRGSLGGNHKTLMIACVSPSKSNVEETMNTLRYANRAKNIKNKAKANVDSGSELVTELRDQLRILATALLHSGDDTFHQDILKQLVMGSNVPTPKLVNKNLFKVADFGIEGSNRTTPSCCDSIKENEKLVTLLDETKQKLNSLNYELEYLREELRDAQDLLSLNQYVSISDSNSVGSSMNDEASRVSNTSNDTTNSLNEEMIERTIVKLKEKEKEREELALTIHTQESYVSRLIYVKNSLSKELEKKQVRVESLMAEHDRIKKCIKQKSLKKKLWFLVTLKSEIYLHSDKLIKIEREIKNETSSCKNLVESIYEIEKEHDLVNEWINDLSCRIQDNDINIFELQYDSDEAESTLSCNHHIFYLAKGNKVDVKVKDLEEEKLILITELRKLKSKSKKLKEKKVTISRTVSSTCDRIKALKNKHVVISKSLGADSMYRQKDTEYDETFVSSTVRDECNAEILGVSEFKKKDAQLRRNISLCKNEISMLANELQNLDLELETVVTVMGSSKVLFFQKTNEVKDMKFKYELMKIRHNEFSKHKKQVLLRSGILC